MRWDYATIAEYFAGPLNPNEFGPSGMFHSFGGDGRLNFRFDNDVGSPAISAIESGAIALSDGSVVFGKDDGHAYALGSDGALRWQFPRRRAADALEPEIVDVFDTSDGPCSLARAYFDPKTAHIEGKTCHTTGSSPQAPCSGPKTSTSPAFGQRGACGGRCASSMVGNVTTDARTGSLRWHRISRRTAIRAPSGVDPP